ncbi:MAG TPA: hypothetical protein VF230_00425 [Acidimicrobiales bacterium]
MLNSSPLHYSKEPATVTTVRTTNSLSVMLAAATRAGLIVVEHPEGAVRTPGGCCTDWFGVALSFGLRPELRVQSLVEVVHEWNREFAQFGCFTADSWVPTRVSVVNVATGVVLANCELNDAAELCDVLAPIVGSRRRS